MTERDRELESYREAFASLDDETAQPESCPDANTIYRAVSGELPSSEVGEIVDHISECQACAQAWQVARTMAPSVPAVPRESETPVAVGRRRKAANPYAWIGLAAAAVLAVAVGVRTWTPEIGSIARSEEEGAVESLLEESQPLSREHFLLRWSDAPEGSRYRLTLTTEELAPVLEVGDLEGPEYLVDEARLADLPSGTRLLWRIETTLPDGEAVSSETFIAILQ